MVSGVAQVQVYGSQKYAVHVQLDPRALAYRQLGIDEVEAARRKGQRQPAHRNALRPAPGIRRAGQRAAHQRRCLSAAGRGLSQWCAGTRRADRHCHRQRRERQARQLVQQHARHRAGHPAPAGHQHRRSGERIKASAADVPQADAGFGGPGHPLRPVGLDPRLGRRREVHPAADHRPGHHGDLPVPAQRLGHHHPQPGAAHVDRGHVRGDVPARLQHRQPVADGADAVGGLRRGRRHRHAGKHRSPHGDAARA